MAYASKKKPEDFCIATGKQYSVRDFINVAASKLGMKIIWKGKGINQVGYFNNKIIVKVDPRYFRPTEVQSLLGDYTKAKQKLKWKPKISFNKLVSEMIDEDLKIAQKEEFIKKRLFI